MSAAPNRPGQSWAFAAERLSPIDKCCSGDAAAGALTSRATLEGYFREAQVRAFACTHTCLAHAIDVDVDGASHVIINNGAAGMANFSGTAFGLITRISADPRRPFTESLWHPARARALRCLAGAL
jgi:hypothetical protein